MAEVQVIPPKAARPDTLRVAAYCRVSSDSADQLHSYAAQIRAYTQAINAQAIVVGLCFANGLSPISGRYGWPFGILAGMLHFTLVTSVPLLHGGFCLYNGGFTAAFVCMFFIPVFEHFFRTKEERRLAKAERTANSQ